MPTWPWILFLTALVLAIAAGTFCCMLAQKRMLVEQQIMLQMQLLEAMQNGGENADQSSPRLSEEIINTFRRFKFRSGSLDEQPPPTTVSSMVATPNETAANLGANPVSAESVMTQAQTAGDNTEGPTSAPAVPLSHAQGEEGSIVSGLMPATSRTVTDSTTDGTAFGTTDGGTHGTAGGSAGSTTDGCTCSTGQLHMAPSHDADQHARHVAGGRKTAGQAEGGDINTAHLHESGSVVVEPTATHPPPADDGAVVLCIGDEHTPQQPPARMQNPFVEHGMVARTGAEIPAEVKQQGTKEQTANVALDVRESLVRQDVRTKLNECAPPTMPLPADCAATDVAGGPTTVPAFVHHAICPLSQPADESSKKGTGLLQPAAVSLNDKGHSYVANSPSGAADIRISGAEGSVLLFAHHAIQPVEPLTSSHTIPPLSANTSAPSLPHNPQHTKGTSLACLPHHHDACRASSADSAHPAPHLKIDIAPAPETAEPCATSCSGVTLAHQSSPLSVNDITPAPNADAPAPSLVSPIHALGMGDTSAAASELACMICLEDYEEEDDVLELPCKHCFHDACVRQWLDKHVTCPACRLNLLPPDADQVDRGNTATNGSPPAQGTNGGDVAVGGLAQYGAAGVGVNLAGIRNLGNELALARFDAQLLRELGPGAADFQQALAAVHNARVSLQTLRAFYGGAWVSVPF